MTTRAQKAVELLGLVERGVDVSFTFAGHDYPSLGKLTSQQRRDAEAFMQDGYRLWSLTWALPLLRELLARDLEPSRRPNRRLTKNQGAMPV
jgi:hypothetical protein